MALITCVSTFMYLFIGNGFHAMMNPWKKETTPGKDLKQKGAENILDLSSGESAGTSSGGEVTETTNLNSDAGNTYGDISIAED